MTSFVARVLLLLTGYSKSVCAVVVEETLHQPTAIILTGTSIVYSARF